jgi:uncharacterized protein YlxW (UPF0749 family)
MTDADNRPPESNSVEPDPAEPPGGADATTARQRRSRGTRWGAAGLIALLTAALGFAIVVQVHANSKSDSLSSLSESDLVVILDDQDSRAQRLREEISDLQAKLRSLQDSGNGAAAAQQQADQDAQTLGILLGTIAATGPGVSVDITDPQHKLTAEQLLDVIEELRGAGAEAIQFGAVRISTDSAFTTVDGKVAVDGTTMAAPYRVLAIGDPTTLSTALTIPGGVAAVLRAAGGNLDVTDESTVTISAIRSLPPTKYVTQTGH